MRLIGELVGVACAYPVGIGVFAQLVRNEVQSDCKSESVNEGSL